MQHEAAEAFSAVLICGSSQTGVLCLVWLLVDLLLTLHCSWQGP